MKMIGRVVLASFLALAACSPEANPPASGVPAEKSSPIVVPEEKEIALLENPEKLSDADWKERLTPEQYEVTDPDQHDDDKQ